MTVQAFVPKIIWLLTKHPIYKISIINIFFGTKDIVSFYLFSGFETAFLHVGLAVLELSLDQANLKIRDPPASVSQELK